MITELVIFKIIPQAPLQLTIYCWTYRNLNAIPSGGKSQFLHTDSVLFQGGSTTQFKCVIFFMNTHIVFLATKSPTRISLLLYVALSPVSRRNYFLRESFVHRSVWCGERYDVLTSLYLILSHLYNSRMSIGLFIRSIIPSGYISLSTHPHHNNVRMEMKEK